MPDPINLHVDGPHSPERTREVADLLAESVRFLNYASNGGPGLEDPADAYSLLGALYMGTERLPQLFMQLGNFLAAHGRSGRLASTDGGPVSPLVATAAYHLSEAHQLAAALTTALQEAQNAISGLYVREGDGA
jgi:hypothetical protein